MFLHMKDIWFDIDDIWVVIDDILVAIEDMFISIDDISVIMDTFVLFSWSWSKSTCWWQYEVMLAIVSVWFWAVNSKPFNSAYEIQVKKNAYTYIHIHKWCIQWAFPNLNSRVYVYCSITSVQIKWKISLFYLHTKFHSKEYHLSHLWRYVRVS